MEKEKRVGEELLIAVLLIGLALGVVAGMAIYASAYPIFQSKEWATWIQALGVILAVVVALWQTYRLERAKHQYDQQKIDGLLSILNEAVSSLVWVSEHLYVKHHDGSGDVSVTELKAFIHCATGTLSVPFYEDPYCRVHAALVYCLSDLRSAKSLVEEAIIGLTDELVEDIDEVAESAREHFRLAFEDGLLRSHDFPRSPYFHARDIKVEVGQV